MALLSKPSTHSVIWRVKTTINNNMNIIINTFIYQELTKVIKSDFKNILREPVCVVPELEFIQSVPPTLKECVKPLCFDRHISQSSVKQLCLRERKEAKLM